MSSCLAAGALVLALGAQGTFTLGWTHSVEKIAWRESWQVTGGRLVLREAAVKGSGAGMEPGDGGHFADGWWVWAPDLPPVPALHLAASGETPSAWRLCGATCTDLGAKAGAALTIAPAACPD